MTNDTINYMEYLGQVKEAFKSKDEILGSELKKILKLEEKGRMYGSLISALIAKKIIVKNEDKFEKENGRPVYYYRLNGESSKAKQKNEDYIIVDQNGTTYEYQKGKDIKEEIQKLINANPKLTISAYKKIGTYRAQISIVEGD